MIQSGDVRYNWKHGILPNPIHHFHEQPIQRNFRISLQFSDFEPWFFQHPKIQQMKIK